MATTTTTIVPPRTVTKLGALAAVNDNVVFGIPILSVTERGVLTLTAQGGAVTGPTFALFCSIDNGTSYFSLPAISSGAPTAAAASGDTAVTSVQQFNVSGLGAALYKYAITAGTGITSMNIYAWIG